MKIFLDTADIEEIKKAYSWGVIDGVTTNPSLVARTGKDFKETVKEIAAIVDGPISAEVLALESKEMVRQAVELAGIHENIVVKIPLTAEGLKAIKELKAKNVKTNATLVFSANQALLAAKAGATFVSPFVGRLDDIGNDGMKLVCEIVKIFQNYDFKTEVIVASVRHPMHVVESAMLGAQIATVPFPVLEKMLKHSLTDKGIKKFLEDAEKSGQKI